ncbi:MAG: hypothetical protein MJ184_07925 [Treponema sp.]|uniref:hypothetical protein n=1 Tax=Treponema sp. TaxID=166 RepID=UPI00298E296C|nr:hypothetical protein [Treponema sp.]MCQ2601275.1 hypothetical protein [Treponema sp.]
MTKISELSAFQRNINILTLYLYLMNTRCKHLQDYDDEGDFETHNYFFKLCVSKLEEKIKDDENLLINHNVFHNFFNPSEESPTQKLSKEKNEENFIQNTYFEYSKSIPKSTLRNKMFNLIYWSFLVILFTSLFMGIFIKLEVDQYQLITKYPQNVNKAFNEFIIDFFVPCSLFICLFVISLKYLIQGLILKSVIDKDEITSTKFRYMYSDDYCYRRIKEAEAFFRQHYNVENDFLELNEIEKKFPKEDNLFYKTILSTKTSESNKKKLLQINDDIYCRAVFSDLFDNIKKEGIEQFQQIPFVFITCKRKANVDITGNTGFSECVNSLCKNKSYTDTTFNQAINKLKNPQDEILPKYLEILKKYENILQ